ncbi:hypothetical protein PCL_09554 [Purpureocillium lilacinum]|uniref:Uncharacterized protein n=1 Tax=Purpureocillium lilacinum TaxID=33203 RepID=A0A2U3DQL8_PURLI|nr:hypothetical protein PCL_09554 [Purpureocillium lilacinum]
MDEPPSFETADRSADFPNFVSIGSSNRAEMPRRPDGKRQFYGPHIRDEYRSPRFSWVCSRPVDRSDLAADVKLTSADADFAQDAGTFNNAFDQFIVLGNYYNLCVYRPSQCWQT